ncbi:MAG: DUF6236 family protein [Ktedonobacteraceae bacterium]
MQDFLGLYYPHIVFPNDAWVKAAVCYWDKMGRMVSSTDPGTYPSDSDVVRQMREALDFVVDFSPNSSDLFNAEAACRKVLSQNYEELRRRYAFSETNVVVFASKMNPEFSRFLEREGFAVCDFSKSHNNYYPILRMHPKIAFIYLATLASEMASTRNLHPVTESPSDFTFTGDYTIGRITKFLLGEANENADFLASPYPAEEIARRIALISFQTAVPKGVGDIPVEKIIRFRQAYRDELTVFQTQLQDFAKNLDVIEGVTDPKAIEAHLKAAYEREIKPQIKTIKSCWKSLAVETVQGIWSIQVALPPIIASSMAALKLAPLPPSIAGPAAIACSIVPVFLKKRKEVSEQQHTSLAAYLLYVSEDLTPTSLIAHITQRMRRMFAGV